jgi:DNA-binding MarR family transcriptional regulator
MPELPSGPSTTTLLRTAYNTLSADIYRALLAAGVTDMRPAHGNAMEMLAIEDGLRLTDIASRAGMAPQSMGEVVDDLVAKGYVERREDPDDRRAKRIYLTRKGRATAQASGVAVMNLEQRLVTLMGEAQYRRMRRQLAGITDHFAPREGPSIAEEKRI